jgi:integrase
LTVLRANPYGSLTRCLALEAGTLPHAEGLLLAMNAHNLDATVACFADDYVNEWPAHPQRGFRGSEQVRRNWSRILAGVPDLRAWLLVQIPKQRKRKILPWTGKEARRFLESARSDSDPLYAAYVLVLVLGLRKGEVRGLAWEAVDFGQGTLRRDHQLQRVRRSLLYRQTKSEASDAWLPMPDIVAVARKTRRSQQDAEREAAR